MKVLTKTYYVFEICGRTSTVQDRIKACQESHKLLEDPATVVEPQYARGEPYPTAIKVIFGDGPVRSYGLRWEVKK